ncbi:MAG TPA: hypothetical protein PKN75_01960 [Bacteroidia bacterium]|nr:hypothetical protein [Bacteroidia bacterium]HNU32339.1 hypothetical protein [Bacteroidia bacterium]
MQHTKLIVLLKSLTTWELKAFEKLVRSPFYNVNENVDELYFIIKKFAPAYIDDELNLEHISKLLFKSKKAQLTKLRYVMTDLTRLLEKFLVMLSLEKNNNTEKKLLLNMLNERNADKFFQIHLTESTIQQKLKPLDMQFYETAFQLEEMQYEFDSSRKNRKSDDALQNLSDNLDLFYLTRKLKYSCEITNRQNILNVQYNNPIIKNVISFLNDGNYKDVPLVAIYHTILLTLSEPDNEKHFVRLKQLLQKHTRQITQKENRDIYAFAQNYCIRKVNTGKTNFLRELFELYKTVLTEKIIFDNKQISHADFKNICAIAIRVNELKWAENFIAEHQFKLPKDLRNNSVNYNMARLHFAKKEYKQAVRLLTQIEFTDVYYHLDSKSLLLKVYYETENLQPLYSLISAFKIYLKRSKLISDYQRLVYKNLVTYVKKFASVKEGKKIDIKLLSKEIEAEKNIADIGWLKEKLNELQ